MTVAHIIDRDPMVRGAARRALEAAGFVVTEASDLERATTPCPELVIADVALAAIPVLRRRYTTARILPLAAHAAPAGGVRKPFTASQILAAVRLSLARPDATTAR